MKKKHSFKSGISSLSFMVVLSTSLTPLSMVSFLEKPVMAQGNQINLISRGDGVFTLQGRQQTEVRSASLNIKNNQDAEVTIVLSNNQTMSFSGRASRQNSQMVRIQVRNSGMASANGTLLVEHNNNDILLLEGKGSLDSQSFSVIFRHKTTSLPPSSDYTPLNLIQRGQGLLNIEGRNNQSINSVSVQVNNQGQANISLGTQRGDRISFSGEESHRDSTNLRIRLTNSGQASAGGFIDIRYGANNSIINLVGDGTIDGQPFLVNFSN